MKSPNTCKQGGGMLKLGFSSISGMKWLSRGFGRWLTVVVVLEVVVWWGYDLMVQWVGCGVGYVRLLGFFFADFFAGFFLFLCFCIPIWGFGRWLTTVVVLVVVVWWGYDLMVQWVGCGVGFARLLVFFLFFFSGIFFFYLQIWVFFREPSKRERVRVLDRGFFCFVYPLS